MKCLSKTHSIRCAGVPARVPCNENATAFTLSNSDLTCIKL